MRARHLITAVVTIASLGAVVGEAKAQAIDALAGQFTFNWLRNPAKTRCAAVDAKLLDLFKSPAYVCDLNLTDNSASGKPKRVCSAKNRSREYLIFATKADCEEERETQMANGD